MSVLIFFIVFYLLLSASLYPLFEKAGEAGWKGLVPGLNFVVWCKLIGRTPRFALWLLFPIVNLFIYAGMAIDMVRSFRKYEFWQSVAAVVLTPLYFFYLALAKEERYDGPTLEKERAYRAQLQQAKATANERLLKKLQTGNPYHKSAAREWVEAIIFAVFAAAFIRMFLIEAYVIPTPSMEDSLLVGDFLFVSKAHYGIRMPQTIAMVPLLHNRIPALDAESYFENPKLPYRRLPALETIDRNDPVVFNYPEGDSVYIFPDRTWSIYDYRRGAIPPPYSQNIKSGQKKLVTRPMDKMDHYIKRCVGTPGDSLQIRDRQVFINGQPADTPRFVEFMYAVTFPGASINTRNFAEWGISSGDVVQQQANTIILILTEEQKAKIQNMDPGISITPVEIGEMEYQRSPGKLFPHDPVNFPGWTVDNYGPLFIPNKGATVNISPENIAPYRRIINVYEGNDLEIKDGRIFINGQETDQYTFKLNYYWMMGDNRHNSEDSRVWGFVPEDHIVGKPLFIWFSTKEGSIRNGINWKRIFTSADKK
jgi:signal peptidase I